MSRIKLGMGRIVPQREYSVRFPGCHTALTPSYFSKIHLKKDKKKEKKKERKLTVRKVNQERKDKRGGGGNTSL